MSPSYFARTTSWAADGSTAKTSTLGSAMLLTLRSGRPASGGALAQGHVDPLALEDLLERLRGLGDVVLGEEGRHVGLLLGPVSVLTGSTIRTMEALGSGVGVLPVLADESPGLVAAFG